MWGDFVAVDLRLDFGLRSSSGYWGVVNAAAEQSHCRTHTDNAVTLDEGRRVVPHVAVTDRREVGELAPVPVAAIIRPAAGGEKQYIFL